MLSIPLSTLATFLALNVGGGTINTMVLGGLALAFSRLIDNSVVVLENIFRQWKWGAAKQARRKVDRSCDARARRHVHNGDRLLPRYFFLWREQVPVHRAGVGGRVIALRFVRRRDDGGSAVLCAVHNRARRSGHDCPRSLFGRFVTFNHGYEQMLNRYVASGERSCVRCDRHRRPWVFLLSLALYPLLGVSFFPRTDPGQFVINIKAPTGTRLELTDQYIKRVEADIREVVPAGIGHDCL